MDGVTAYFATFNFLNGIPRGFCPRKGYSIEFCANRRRCRRFKVVHAGRSRKYITIGIGLAHR